MAPQVVLMTGCSAGIGLATAQRLARDRDQRYIVIATVIAMAEKTELVASIGDALERTIFIKQMNITKEEDIARVVDDVIKVHGRIDVLLNIAGIATFGIPERVSREKMESIFSVNTIGTIRLTQAVLPHMKKNMEGKIISFSSVAGKQGIPYGGIYCASKFALEGFFESLVSTVRAFNIRVCLLEPDQVNTGLLSGVCSEMANQIKEEAVDDIDRRQLRCLLKVMREFPTLNTSDVVDALIGNCLEVDDPVFRHLLVPEGGREAMAEAVVDLTGETSIKALQELVETS